MATTNINSIKTRLKQKNDTEANWIKAVNFIPLKGEIIVYNPDKNYDTPRVKVGDGVTKVNDLPFLDEGYGTSKKEGLIVSKKMTAGLGVSVVSVLNPKQNGSGTPSLSNIRQISKFSSPLILTQSNQNLLNFNLIEQSTSTEHNDLESFFITSDGILNFPTQNAYNYALIPVFLKKNTSYTLWYEFEIYERKNAEGNTNVAGGFLNKTAITKTLTNNGVVNIIDRYTSSEDVTAKIRIYSNTNSTSPAKAKVKVMLLEGNYSDEEIPSYIPPNTKTIEANFPDNFYGGTYNWGLNQFQEKYDLITLDGTETINDLGNGLFEILPPSFSAKNFEEVLCSHFQGGKKEAYDRILDNSISVSENSIYIYTLDFLSASDLKVFLSIQETKVQVLYQTKVSTFYKHNDLQPIYTFEGKNIFFDNQGEIRVLFNGPNLITKEYLDLEKVENKTAQEILSELPIAGEKLGLVKNGGDVSISSSGIISVNDDSHNHIIGNIDGLQNSLDDKSNFNPKYSVSAGDEFVHYVKLFSITPLSTYQDFIYCFELTGRDKNLLKFYIYVQTASNKYINSSYVEYEGLISPNEEFKAFRFKDEENETETFEFWGKIRAWNTWKIFPKTCQKHNVTITWEGTKSSNYPENSSTEVAVKRRPFSANLDGDGNEFSSTYLKNASLVSNNIKWGGEPIQNGTSPIDAAMVAELGTNRLAYMNGEDINIEYSNDGGETWIDYGETSDEKRKLVTLERNFSIGKKTSSDFATTLDKLRVTITASSAHSLYFSLRKILICISSNGAKKCKVLIEKNTFSNLENFTQVGLYSISGWSGWNSIPVNSFSFGGHSGRPSNSPSIRLTFYCEEVSDEYPNNFLISKIRMFGENAYSFPSNLAKEGTLYSADIGQNMILPSSILIKGDSYEFTTSTLKKRGTISINSLNQIFIEQKETNNNYSEKFLLPRITTGLTMSTQYDILTTKTVVYYEPTEENPTPPNPQTGMIWLKPI